MRDGTLFVQRTYPGVGLIFKRSGSHSKVVRNRMHATLDSLYERNRLDILEWIRDNRISVKEVHDKFVTGRLDSIAVSDLGVLKWVTEKGDIHSPMFDWVKKADLAETTRTDYKKRFLVFLKSVRSAFELPELAKLLKEFKTRYRDRKRSFNAVRTALMAFLNDTSGEDDPTYKKVKGIKPYTYKANTSRIHPLSVKEVLLLLSRLRKLDKRFTYPETHPKYQRGEKAAKMLWSLCLLGTNWKEYAVDGWKLQKREKRIDIYGEKRDQRDRYIPLIDASVTKPLLSLKDFRRYLGAVTKGRILVKDTRNTFIKWCYSAGIPHLRVEFYAGHQSKAMSIYYATGSGPSKEEVEGDGTLLREFIERERLTVTTPQTSFIVKSGTPVHKQ
jgi:hypothetical protein